MKKWIFLLMLLGWVSSLEARVVLPESRFLAGPLDPVESEYGDEFFQFADFMGAPAPPGQSLLNGWLEVRFGEPEGDLVEFVLNWDTVGTREEIQFGGGQRYQIFKQQTLPSPIDASTGVLNLETGQIEDISINIFVQNLAILQYTRINRVPPDFPNSFPPIGSPPFPPGFIAAEGAFRYNSDGEITGFEFIGQTFAPGGFAAANNDASGSFPFYSWGPNGESYFPNPASCAPGTPDASCPTEENNPDGIELPLNNFLHPHFFLRSDRLKEATPERLVPACPPANLPVGGVMVETGGRIYHIGGRIAGMSTGRVVIFDPRTNTWETGPPMPFSAADAQGVAIGEKIYIFGGRRYNRSRANVRLQVLDTTTGTWSRLSDAPTPVALGAAASFSDWIFIVGGRTNRPNGSPAGNLKFSGVLQVYDAANDSWSEVPALLGTDTVYGERPSAVTAGSKIYVVGGLDRDGEVTARTVVIDVLTSTLSAGPAAFWNVYDAAAGLLGDSIIVSGGRREAGGASDDVMQLLDLTQGTWLRSRSQPIKTSASNGAIVNGQLWVSGASSMGSSDAFPGPTSASVHYYDTTRGWQVCEDRPIFNASEVLNTAALTVGPRELSPGSQASIIGRNLASATLSAPIGEAAPAELAGVSITVDGVSAPILRVSPERVDFQIPYEATVGASVPLTLTNAAIAQSARTVEIPLAEVSPGIFIQSCGVIDEPDYLNGSTALACKQDGTLAYMGNAIPPGDVAIVQMNGLGPVDPPLATGQRAPEDGPSAVFLPTVTIRGADGQQIPAEVLSARLAPGEVGIFDVEVLVPPESQVGNRVQLEVTVNGVAANRAVIPVGQPVKDNLLNCVRDSLPEMRQCIPGIRF